MALPQLRSMNGDFDAGATDGKYRKIAPNRGGDLSHDATHTARQDLFDTWYSGPHEAHTMVRGDGKTVTDPYFISTLPPLEVQ